jgi:ATP phosphoribosyltransferase regulatory subunit
MSSLEISYPIGVQPLDRARTAARRRCEAIIVQEMQEAGYGEVILPVIDFVAPYTGIAREALLRQSYRFVDRDGELVWVRSDFTPMLARTLAPRLDSPSLPVRAFYRGDVVRCQDSRLGGTRDLYQIGAEKIGGDEVASDVEILSLAASIFSALRLPVVVSITDASLLDVLLESFDGDERARIRSIVQRKASHELEPLGSSILLELIRGDLTLERLLAIPPTRRIGQRLADTIASLPRHDGVRWILHTDDVATEPGYYSGLRFQIDSADGTATLGSGGRYDTLYGRFGFDTPAVGFTLNLDPIEVRP